MAKTEVNIIIKATDKASKKIKGIAGAMAGMRKAAAGLAVGGLAVAAIGIKKLVDVSGEAIQLANVQAKAEAQLQAALESTGMAAGLTADELKNMASSLQSQTTFGDEAIIGAESLLLTFTKIGKEAFPGALEATLNLSTAMGQDLKTSALQVGKALNDPVAGLGSLSRAGIQFTDSQKEMIKSLTETGQVAKAQQIILAELESQFGGSAAAAAQTFGGQMQQLSNTIGDLKEGLGFALIEGLQPVIAMFTQLATEIMPPLSEIFAAFGAQLAEEMPEILSTFSEGLADVASIFGLVDESATGTEAGVASLKAIFEGIVPVIQSVVEAFAAVAEIVKTVDDAIKSFSGGTQSLGGVLGAFNPLTSLSSATGLFSGGGGGGGDVFIDGQKAGEITGGHQGAASRDLVSVGGYAYQ